MRCYRCDDLNLVLAPLWPHERKEYSTAGIVLRICANCGLEQNRVGDDEEMTANEAAFTAPSQQVGSRN